VVGGVVFLMTGANRPSDPSLRSPARQRVEGFGEIAFHVKSTPAAKRCALLAQTSDQRARGLMERTDLGGYDGMLFVFPSDSRDPFYMLNTPMPLSIAWFDSGGTFLSATDMEPCLDQSDCPRYSPGVAYRYALEVPKGRLGALGIGPETTIEVGGPCT
jgi:uncharacterized membrane protein (UPF0127 family)